MVLDSFHVRLFIVVHDHLKLRLQLSKLWHIRAHRCNALFDARFPLLLALGLFNLCHGKFLLQRRVRLVIATEGLLEMLIKLHEFALHVGNQRLRHFVVQTSHASVLFC